MDSLGRGHICKLRIFLWIFENNFFLGQLLCPTSEHSDVSDNIAQLFSIYEGDYHTPVRCAQAQAQNGPKRRILGGGAKNLSGSTFPIDPGPQSPIKGGLERGGGW